MATEAEAATDGGTATAAEEDGVVIRRIGEGDMAIAGGIAEMVGTAAEDVIRAQPVAYHRCWDPLS